MSRFEEKTLTCPKCGHTFTAEIATSLNVSNKPVFRTAVLTGEFQKFKCEQCGSAFLVDHPLMYIDFNRKLWIAMFPESFEPRWCDYETVPSDNFSNYMTGDYSSPAAREMAKGFVVRAVFGLPALAEKIICLEAGLDDSLLAVFKLEMMQSIDGLQFNPFSRPRLLGIRDSEMAFRAKVVGDNEEVHLETLVFPVSELSDLENRRDAYGPLLEQLSGGSYIDIGRMMFDCSPREREKAAES